MEQLMNLLELNMVSEIELVNKNKVKNLLKDLWLNLPKKAMSY